MPYSSEQMHTTIPICTCRQPAGWFCVQYHYYQLTAILFEPGVSYQPCRTIGLTGEMIYVIDTRFTARTVKLAPTARRTGQGLTIIHIILLNNVHVGMSYRSRQS